jgi:hypothetical protein
MRRKRWGTLRMDGIVGAALRTANGKIYMTTRSKNLIEPCAAAETQPKAHE